MTKHEFLGALRARLSSLPEGELSDRLDFYSEMIDDFIEEGNSEEEAVSKIGSLDEIVSQILSDARFADTKWEEPKKKTYTYTTHKERRGMRVWEIVLLVLGAPVWLSLLVAAISIVLSLYASVWAVIISLWAVFVSFVACGFAGLILGVGFAVIGQGLNGLACVGAGFILAGFSIFIFFGCHAVTRLTCILTKNIIVYTKNKLIGKEKKR